jgi:hypothetical protein
MKIKLSEHRKRDPITCTKTLPMGETLRKEYDDLDRELAAEGFPNMHSFARELLHYGIIELREQLAEHKKNKAS